MHIALRAATITLSALVVVGLGPALRASAQDDGMKLRHRPTRATAVARGVQLNAFGSRVDLGSSTATIEAVTTAAAKTVGVGPKRETVAEAKVDALNERKFAQACVPTLALFDLLDVQMTCGESRVQNLPPVFADDAPTHTGAALLGVSERRVNSNPQPTDNGGPQAVSRGSALTVGIRRTALLQPHLAPLRTLLDALVPVSDQTVSSASGRIHPSSAAVLNPLSVTLGLNNRDLVKPVVPLLEQLLNGLEQTNDLATIKLVTSSTHANGDAEKVVALAQAGGGQIDVLPGLAPGGAPLCSITIAPARSIASFNRATAVGTPTYEPGVTTMRVNLHVLSGDLGALTVEPGVPVTLLAGTALETTVSTGGGHTVEGDDGSVQSFVHGVSVHALKGVKGGISIRLGYAESALGGPQPVSGAGGPDRRGLFLVAGVSLGATLLLLGYTVRRQRVGREPQALRQPNH